MNGFDEAAKTWDDEAKLARARRVAGLLRTALPMTGEDRVLDIGAGTGQLSFNLAEEVGQVVVSDASDGMVEMAARNIIALGLAEKMSALKLDLTEEAPVLEPFDGAWSMLALHHIPHVETLLERVHALLRPGAWFAVVDLDKDVDGAFHAHVGEDFHGHHGFDRDSFSKMLEATGFTDIRTEDAGHVDRELETHGEAGHTKSFPMFLAIATRR